jgi:hypothetical protein
MNTIRDIKFEWCQGFGNVVRPILLMNEVDPETIEFEVRDGNYIARIGSIVESFYDMGDYRGMQGRPLPAKMKEGGVRMLCGLYPVPPINFPEIRTIECLITQSADDFAKEENLQVAPVLLDDIVDFINEHPLVPAAVVQVKRLNDNISWTDFAHRDVETGDVAAKDYGEFKHAIVHVLTEGHLAEA